MEVKKHTEKRPWGKFEQYCQNQKCTVKILFIKPREEFSLQYHKNRDEFWKIIEGTGQITINKKKTKTKQGDEFFIAKKSIHQAKAGPKGIKILEISFGKFNENDIVRLKDKYNRI